MGRLCVTAIHTGLALAINTPRSLVDVTSQHTDGRIHIDIGALPAPDPGASPPEDDLNLTAFLLHP